MTLKSIMTSHVITASMDDSLRHVRDLFALHRIHHVIVTDQHRVVGIISDRDLLANISPFLGGMQERPLDAASLNRKAHQIMTRTPIAARPDTPVGNGAAMLLDNRISCLPIIDLDGGCAGIVTWRDVLRWAFKTRAMQAGDVGPSTIAA